MLDWSRNLKGNPLPWLLESENPSVRYWTLIEILERTADDPDVLESQSAIAESRLVQQLFNLQHPDGHWGEDPAKPYTAQGAVGVLSLLHMLGVTPDDRTKAGCNSFLRFSQNECGGLSLVKTQRSGIFPCTTGEHLPMLVYFGFGQDPRVRSAFNFVIQSMSTEKALDCGRYQHRDCLWGAIATLNGLSVLPEDLVSPLSNRVVDRLCARLLEACFDFEGEHKRWFTFGVPRVWDLLSMLKVLALCGFSGDPRFREYLNLVLERQDGEGRWKCGSVSRTWPLERQNQPSKWVTLDVLRILKKTGV